MFFISGNGLWSILFTQKRLTPRKNLSRYVSKAKRSEKNRMVIIVCPNCGYHFKRPFLTEKRSGLGFSFGPLGHIKCPSCGFRGDWGKFKNEKDLPPNFVPASGKTSVTSATPKSAKEEEDDEQQEKTLDETIYEKDCHPSLEF